VQKYNRLYLVGIPLSAIHDAISFFRSRASFPLDGSACFNAPKLPYRTCASHREIKKHIQDHFSLSKSGNFDIGSRSSRYLKLRILIETWSTFADVQASIEPIPGRECATERVSVKCIWGLLSLIFYKREPSKSVISCVPFRERTTAAL